MSELTHNKVFIDSGDLKRECEDLSYTTFANLNQKHNKNAISFFRSDFRGSSFNNCNFHKNNFDRADLISCFFSTCSFDCVDIAASEIKNCYFYDTTFEGNQYNHTSFQECTFENCKFENEDFLINMKSCIFDNCTINNCTFERSTTEQATFKDCIINNTDFATMHAERHKFVSCKVENVRMDISYIFGYFFYNTDLNNIQMLYRGERVFLTEENTLGHYADLLYDEKRYYEFLNAHIICRDFETLPKLINSILEKAINYRVPIRRLEIQGIFELLLFYTVNGVLPFAVYFQVIKVLDAFAWDDFSAEEKFDYLANTQKLKLVIENGNYNLDFINSATNDYSILTIHCNTEDFDEALDVTNTFLDTICESLGIQCDFELIDKKKGSWLLIFAIATSIALLIPKVVSESVNVVVEVNTKLHLNKVIKNKLKKNNITTNEIKEIAQIASTAGLLKGSTVQINPSKIIDALSVQI